jgi:hypothetical protein
MNGLLSGLVALAQETRLACAWRMPHPTDPDPIA